VTFRYADGEERIEAGEAFYTPPGHVPVKHAPGTEFVLFSPHRRAGADRGGHAEEHGGDAAGVSRAQAGTATGNSSSGQV
jgi:hypothetical protein